jgi:hypothetical protein
MFDYDPPEEEEKEPTDYSGLIIGLLLVPVFVLVTYLANADMALGVVIVLGMTMLAVKMRWELRKHVWFWVIIVFILGLHTPLVFMFRLPPHGNVPTLTYTMPIGIVDFFIIIVLIDTAERIFSKDSSFTTINWR